MDPLNVLLVAGHGAVPIGRLVLHPDPSGIRVAEIGLLPGWRRRGIGTALLRAVCRDAAETGRPVTLHVEADHPARALYDRLGFRPVGEAWPRLLLEWRA